MLSIAPFGAVVFDFDLTLADSVRGIVKCFNLAFEKLGYSAEPPEVIIPTIGYPVTEAFANITGTDDKKKSDEFYDVFAVAADEHMNENTVFIPGARELLASLRAHGRHTAVVSSKPSRRIGDFLARQGASDLIDFAIGPESVTKMKPDPEGLLLAAERMKKEFGIEKDGILYVGDSRVDFKTAHAADIAFIAVASGSTPAEYFAEQGKICLSSVAEFRIDGV